MTDMISFEPCDDNFRPLNILNISDVEIIELIGMCEHLPGHTKNKDPDISYCYEPQGISSEV